MRAKLSVILIVKNEAAYIHRCLQSVSWADEIIVLDSGSTDGTLEIARTFTSHVYETDWPGYGIQKNRALAKASYPWVLALDGDEELTPELQDEIQRLLENLPTFDGYAIRRQSLFCGRWIRYGDWRSDWVVRLWRKDVGKFDERLVHEKLLLSGATGRLTHLMRHYTYPELSVALNKMNIYSSLWAEEAYHQGKRGSVLKGWGRALWSFCRGYVFRGGFFDGWQGFVLAITNAIGTFYKYVKLKQLNSMALDQKSADKTKQTK